MHVILGIQLYFIVTGDQHISVKISPFGWAWLVTGRKLFIWRYMPGAEAKVCLQLLFEVSAL